MHALIFLYAVDASSFYFGLICSVSVLINNILILQIIIIKGITPSTEASILRVSVNRHWRSIYLLEIMPKVMCKMLLWMTDNGEVHYI